MLLVLQLMQRPFYRIIRGLFLRTIIPLCQAPPLAWPLHSLAPVADRRRTPRRRRDRRDQLERRPAVRDPTPAAPRHNPAQPAHADHPRGTVAASPPSPPTLPPPAM